MKELFDEYIGSAVELLALTLAIAVAIHMLTIMCTL